MGKDYMTSGSDEMTASSAIVHHQCLAFTPWVEHETPCQLLEGGTKEADTSVGTWGL